MAKKSKVKDADKIQGSVDKIRDSCDEIEEEIKDKKSSCLGDPVCVIYD
jgi:hypothetical protein